MSTAIQNDSRSPGESRRSLLASKLRNAARALRHRSLSFAQQRLWFLDQLEPNTPVYNVATLARVEGVLDLDALEYAINSIVSRHEVLRTRFLCRDETPEQIISASLKLTLQRLDLTGNPNSEAEAQRIIREEVLRPFDLA